MSPMVKLPLTIEHALLGFLAERPRHAYEIHRLLMRPEALGLVWHLKQSLLYMLLERLEAAGYLSASPEARGGRPPRKLLRLTDAGEAAFAHWRVTPVAHGRDFRLEFLAKLYFAQQEGPAVAGALVVEQRAVCEVWLGELRSQAAALAPGGYDWLVLQFRIGQLEASLAWLGLCAGTVASPGAGRGDADGDHSCRRG